MKQLTVTVVVLCLLTGFGLLRTADAASQSEESADVEMSDISGDIKKPRRHFRLRNPADLKSKDAIEVYDIIRNALKAGYKRSGHPVAATYQGWKRYNTAPYLSISHGNHYLNNYANSTAKAYGAFEDAGTMPVGSIIAKDSFSITMSRGIVLGPLFIAEKMPPGFNYVTGDWRYTEILPDGTLLGETNGEGAERVEYCIACHLAAEKQDHLYFIPKKYRNGALPERLCIGYSVSFEGGRSILGCSEYSLQSGYELRAGARLRSSDQCHMDDLVASMESEKARSSPDTPQGQ